MNWAWTVLPFSYVVCGLAPLVLVPYVVSNRAKPGSTGLLVALVGIAVWALGLALLAVGVGGSAAGAALLGAATVAMLGSQLAGAGFLLLGGEYTGRLAVTRRRLLALGAVLALAQLPALTDPLHGLVFGVTDQPLLDQAAIGPVGVGLILLTLAAALVGLAVLVLEAVTAAGVRRQQSIALSVAGAVTVGAFLFDVYALASFPLPTFPPAFGVTGLAVGWALFRADFLDVVPVAHRRIVEEMDDAAVIVDGSGRVVECNPAARRLVGSEADYAGTPVEAFFDSTPEIADALAAGPAVETELSVTVDGATRHLDLTLSRLDGSGAVSADPGRLVVLRDVTALKEREAQLEFLQQVQARVLRHNIRNTLNVIRGNAETLTESDHERHAAVGETIVAKSDDLLALSRKSRTIERVVDRDRVTEPVDLTATLDRLVGSVRDANPDVDVSLAAPDQCVIEADRWLEAAFELVLENAVAHNDATRPSVAVTVRRTDGGATVRIADDGPGIPQDELAVLERGEETELEHGSGIGLWIVHWIVERSRASIEFDTGDGGTAVSIRIPA